VRVTTSATERWMFCPGCGQQEGHAPGCVRPEAEPVATLTIVTGHASVAVLAEYHHP
jgi:hypothetical protein